MNYLCCVCCHTVQYRAIAQRPTATAVTILLLLAHMTSHSACVICAFIPVANHYNTVLPCSMKQ
eukprot:3677-Heterococcus_DN1.PRE.2